MQARGIIGPGQTTWSEQDWSSLWKLKKAEGEGAIDQVIAKTRRREPYVAVLRSEDGTQKYLLTPTGLERYHFYKSQSSIRVFEDHGVTIKAVFHMTDLAGHPFFDSNGGLTDEGEAAYDAMVRGEAPLWKYDWEPVPERALPKEKKGDPPEIKAMKLAGMSEIRDDEERWLLQTTRCSERQLETQTSFSVVQDTWRKRPRYFMSPKDPVFAMVARYRGGDHSIQGIGGTATFGKGAGGICN